MSCLNDCRRDAGPMRPGSDIAERCRSILRRCGPTCLAVVLIWNCGTGVGWAGAERLVGCAAAMNWVGQKSKLDQDEEASPPSKAPPKKAAKEAPSPEPKTPAKDAPSPEAKTPAKKDSPPAAKTPPKSDSAPAKEETQPPSKAAPAEKKTSAEDAKKPRASRSPKEEEEETPPKKRPTTIIDAPPPTTPSMDAPLEDGAPKKKTAGKPARKTTVPRKTGVGRGRPEASKAEEPGTEDAAPKKAMPRSSTTTVIDGASEDEARDEDVFDVLYLKDETRPAVKIRLLDEDLDLNSPFRPGPKVKADGRREFAVFPGSAKRYLRHFDIRSIEPYEERIVGLAADMLRIDVKTLVGPGNASLVAASPAAERIPKAEELLRSALAEHDSAVQRGLRADPGWNKRLREPLAQSRINLRLCMIDQLIRQNAPNVESECDRLAEEIRGQQPPSASLHPGFADLRQRVDRIVAAKARRALDQGEYATVRELLEGFAGRYAGTLGIESQKVQDTLMERAAQLVAEAEKLKPTEPEKAVERLELAMKIWPRLSGLDSARRTMDREYPILRCAYPELPRTLCPLMVRTPVERHAMSLVCESLLRWVDDPRIGSHYEPQLARGLPQPLARGRAFELPRCRWPDDAAGKTVRWCMVDDVRFTVKVLEDRKLPWYSPLYGELSPRVEDAGDGDPFSLLVYLSKDYWQPLALMDFKVLPSHCFEQDKQGADLAAAMETFGQNPVGTGPYRALPADKESPNQRRFVANPYYRVADQPYIREIVLQRLDPAPAVEVFLQKKIDLIYGVQPEHVNQLEQQLKEVRTLRPPTVWFLAPNYRVDLLKNQNLRLAIAHGIDREAILRQYFRPGRRAADHKTLTGPFPPDCWANNPDVPPFSPARAKAYVEAARGELRRPLSLRLAYPAGSNDVEMACQQIESQLRALEITLKLEKLEPEDFYRRVIDNRNFDLAYWSYTFSDVTYSLEPLLRPDQHDRDANLRNAWNIMGYVPDADLERLFQEIHAHKQFLEVRQYARKIHEHVTNEAIIIPLWQLYVYVAIGDRLRNPTVALDPLVLFSEVERWKLESRR